MSRMTAKEASEYLGIGLKSLYQKVHRGEVAYWKDELSNRLEFEREDLDLLRQWKRVEAKVKRESVSIPESNEN